VVGTLQQSRFSCALERLGVPARELEAVRTAENPPKERIRYHDGMLAGLSLLVALWVAQIPCAPNDLSIVCQCKEGSPSACAALEVVNPELARDILRLLTMAKAAKDAKQATEKSTGATVDSGCGEPPGDDDKKCVGQEHHLISKLVFEALEKSNLKGVYHYRDPRFVARAADQKAHCGYEGWHRNLDREIAAWIQKTIDLTPEKFESFLREAYRRPEIKARFPNGF